MLKEEESLLPQKNMAENTHHIQLKGGIRGGVLLKQEATIEQVKKGKLETYLSRSPAGQPTWPHDINPILRNEKIKSSQA